MQMLTSQQAAQSQGPRRLPGALLAVALAACAATGARADITALEISQARQLDRETPTIRLYLDVDAPDRAPVTQLQGDQITASLAENPLEIAALAPFDAGREGIAYVFLIDISKSLSDREFELILEALDVWVLSLGPRDRVAVIAFGDKSRLVVDFTRDATAIQAGLYSLGPTDDRTMLHEALRDGLELCGRRDPGLPGRRVMMVLTDGRDEGSGLTAEDVLELLRSDPVPIYAIGLSRIQNLRDRRRYLDQLNRLAANSGGAFFEGSTDTLGTAYEFIRRAIRNVWTVDLTCATCPLDGEARRLQLLLTDNERVLSAGRHIRLLPTATMLAASSSRRAASSDAPAVSDPDGSEQADTEPQEPAASRGGASRWFWFLLVFGAVSGAAFWTWWRRRQAAGSSAPPHDTAAAPAESEAPSTPARAPTPAPAPAPAPTKAPVEARSNQVEPEAEKPESGSVEIPVPFTTDSGIETTRPPRPAIMRLVRMIVVRGSKPGRQYALTLFQKAVVGSRSSCDCVMIDPGVEPQQFEISQRDGRVYLKNLSESNPTLVDGVPPNPSHPLKSNCLVGNRDFIVRLVYEDARPINT